MLKPRDLAAAIAVRLGPRLGYPLNRLFYGSRFDGWVRIYPTLACNLRCPYCSNRHNKAEYRGHEFQLLPAEKWMVALNRLNRHVVITGGEPFLYPGIIDLVNGINPDLQVRLYTNLSARRTVELAQQFSRPVSFYVSYHPESGPPDTLIETVRTLNELKIFSGVVHAIRIRGQAARLASISQAFASSGIELLTDPDQRIMFPGSMQQARSLVKCKRRIILVGPDGRRYHCVSKLVRMKDPVGNLVEDLELPEQVEVECGDYGFCAPCDFLGETSFKKL